MARVSVIVPNATRAIVSAIALLLLAATAHAQREYDVWYFGYGQGIDFRTGTPSALTGGAIRQMQRSKVAHFDRDGLRLTEGV